MHEPEAPFPLRNAQVNLWQPWSQTENDMTFGLLFKSVIRVQCCPIGSQQKQSEL